MNIDFKKLLISLEAEKYLPIIKEGTLPGIICEDHMTWVVDPKNQNDFIDFWKKYLNTNLIQDIWETKEYPALHIALKPENTTSILHCEGMIGLSVPLPGDKVLNQTLIRFPHVQIMLENGQKAIVPGVPQHIAYAIDHAVSMADARKQIESLGYDFFTPIIEYKDEGGSVEQCFFGCKEPFGPFAELVRRVGNPKQAFAAGSIDFLYKHYDIKSNQLEEGNVS